MKAELTDAIKVLTKQAAVANSVVAEQYAAAVNNLMQALGMLHHMEQTEKNPAPEGGTD